MLVWLGCSTASAHPDHPPNERTVDVVVDLADRASGWLSIEATFYDLDRRELKFRQMGVPGEYEYEDVRFFGEDGPIEASFEEPHWSLTGVPESGPIRLTWRVKPGGKGRHGHQGWVAEEWASFDGRIMLLPQSRRSLRTARFKFLRPDGWSVVHPFVEDGEWLVMHEHRSLKSALTATCVALGDYEIRGTQYGETEFRVGAPRWWSEEHREVLFEKSNAVYGWFDSELGFDRGSPFSIAWLPRVGKQKVFGGASVNGACYEHPIENPRNWLLLGHRVGHPMNKYTPAGMTIRDKRDHWFMEGWASYIEIVAAAESGALPDQEHWNIIWRRHLRELAKHPEYDIVLAEESKHPEASEYVHYTKGPLVVRHLDLLLRERSGVNLEMFMAEMWKKHGFHRNTFALREEIERYTGDDYSDFWAVFVDAPGAPYPTWPEMVDENLERRMKDAPAAYVGDVPIHGEYLFWLAWSGRFERYADIESFLIESTHSQAVLESRGRNLLPASVRAFQFALPAQAQEAIARTAMAWDITALPRPSGCMASPDPSARSIRWSDSADGKTFARLLELEREYEAKLGTSVGAVRVRVPNTPTRRLPRLGVSPGEPFVLQTTWVNTPPRSGFELWVGGRRTRAKQLTMDPSWVNTHVNFEVADRPGDASILIVKVGPDSAPVLDFPIWQRSAPFARGPTKSK